MFFYPVAWALDTSAPSQSDGLIHTPLTVQKVVRIKNHCATLDLPSNPSTGYDWQVHRYDADVIAHIQKTYKPPQETKGLVGVPGFTRFVFKLHPHVTIHSTDIWVSYSRPWEKPSPPSILRLVG